MGEKVELLDKYPTRTGSLCKPDISSELIKAYENEDIFKFEEILVNNQKKKRSSSEGVIDDEVINSLLITASKGKKTEFLRILIKYGGNPNFFDKVLQVSPIHAVCKQGDLNSLRLLLSCANTDINLRDTFGCTALHYAVKDINCLSELLKHPSIDVNVANRKGETPLHAAVKHDSLEAVEILIGEKGKKYSIDLDRDKFRGKTARTVIGEKYPHLQSKLAEIENRQNLNSKKSLHELFTLLEEEPETFTSIIGDYSHLIDESDGLHTFLQVSCEKGYLNAVEKLISLGANPNLTGSTAITKEQDHQEGYGTLPSMIAAFNGFKDILKILNGNQETKFSDFSGTALHSAIEGSIAPNVKGNHFQCLKYLLENIPRSKLDINKGDLKGNTALHLSAKVGSKEMILLLLRNGAYIGSCNVLGEPAFAKIKHEVLKISLDECVKDNEKLPQDENYEIIFEYKILAPFTMSNLKSNESNIAGMEEGSFSRNFPHESDVLLKICDSRDLNDLLKHPVISSFLHLKWDRVCKYFYFNVLFYLIFWALLTAYILGIYSVIEKEPAKGDTNSTLTNNNWIQERKVIMQILMIFFLLLLVLRESFQFITTPKKYILNAENWLEMGIILVTIWILCDQTQSRKQPISAVGILLSWAELVLLVGRFPILSTYIEMLKTVTMNFLKFLSWYSILIVAFALSFYTLFHQSQSDDFEDLGVSTFKTVIMLTGEFDADSIPFVQHPGTSHILFVIFVFLIAIVLFNLLNGLAVSDTQQIKSEAELVGYKSRVKLISYIETMLCNPYLCKGTVKLKSMFCCFPNSSCKGDPSILWDINICSEIYNNPTARVLPNLGNRVETFSPEVIEKQKEFEKQSKWFNECSRLQMRPEIVKSAKEVLDNRKSPDDLSLADRIMGIEKKIDVLMALIENKFK